MYNCLSGRRGIATEDSRNGRTTIFRLIDSQWLLLSASMRAHVHPTQVTIHSHTERARRDLSGSPIEATPRAVKLLRGIVSELIRELVDEADSW